MDIRLGTFILLRRRGMLIYLCLIIDLRLDFIQNEL